MAQAASLFYSSNPDEETLHSRIIPTNEHNEFLREKWGSLVEYLTKDLNERTKLPIKTWLQGSYKFGTMIRPLKADEEYDVDLGMYFLGENLSDLPKPSQLKQSIQASLNNYPKEANEVKNVEVPSKERCERIYFAKQFHIDVPGYFLNEEQDLRRLATNTKGWEDSDPKALVSWFLDQSEKIDRPQIKRLVQYFKAWAVLKFDQISETRPSSILLTVLVTQCYVDSKKYDLDDEDAFCMAIESIYARLSKDSKVPNPKNPSENLNRFSEDDFKKFIAVLENLRSTAQKARNAEDSAAAALIWSDIYGYFMLLPSEDASIVFENSSGGQMTLLPSIGIQVIKDGQVLATYKDEVPSVDKKLTLLFQILNPQIIPQNATIDWVVRNEGSEAALKGDLGHQFIGTRDLKREEGTAYNGRHFMDCIVRLYGEVIAVKRVQVFVKDSGYKKPPPKKPWYARYVKRRRR